MKIPIAKTVLKKELGLLGSFSLGFADVGADIFLALGMIAAYAHGFMPLAILIASIVYICSGLAYAELSAAMPVSGGASSFGKKAFGNWVGFIAGWGLILDYTIGIALFAVASAGYLAFFIPQVRLFFPLVSSLLIFILMGINLIGIKESSAINSILTIVAIFVIFGLIGIGFSSTFDSAKFLSDIKPIETDPGVNNFLYSITLAMVAFVGIESISQGAAETKNPGKTIPRATMLSIFFVVLFALVLSVMALGIVTPEILKQNMDNPLVPIAQALPYSDLLVPIIAIAGFTICFVSANTGIIGVSRVVYSMSCAGLLSKTADWLHPKFQTPWVTIIVFSFIAMILAFSGNMVFLGELYAFGALTAYSITNLALISLRINNPLLHRPFKIPLNMAISGKEIPLISIIGVISCIIVFSLVALLHEEGRNFAFLWFIFGLGYFLIHEKRKKSQSALSL